VPGDLVAFMDACGMDITSAIALIPNDLTSRHFFLVVLKTFLEACVFGLVIVAIDAVEFDHTTVLVGSVGQDTEASFQRTDLRRRFLRSGFLVARVLRLIQHKPALARPTARTAVLGAFGPA